MQIYPDTHLRMTPDEAIELIASLSKCLLESKKRIGMYSSFTIPCVKTEEGTNYPSQVTFEVNQTI